jgi:hypothetical protein
MTDLSQLQQYLKDTGRYNGAVDGLWGRLTEAAILLGMTDGPDTQLTEADYAASAKRMMCPVSHIKAIASVEAAGAGFDAGKPKILPERHIFSKLTGHKFDRMFPNLSYPKWGTLPYPRTQDDRYGLLLQLIRVDVDAGFGCASYGKFQILGANFKACGYTSDMEFAFAMAKDEAAQLQAFEGFIAANGILPFLRAGNWAEVAKRYNGTAYRENKYDTKLAAAAKQFGG